MNCAAHKTFFSPVFSRFESHFSFFGAPALLRSSPSQHLPPCQPAASRCKNSESCCCKFRTIPFWYGTFRLEEFAFAWEPRLGFCHASSMVCHLGWDPRLAKRSLWFVLLQPHSGLMNFPRVRIQPVPFCSSTYSSSKCVYCLRIYSPGPYEQKSVLVVDRMRFSFARPPRSSFTHSWATMGRGRRGGAFSLSLLLLVLWAISGLALSEHDTGRRRTRGGNGRRSRSKFGPTDFGSNATAAGGGSRNKRRKGVYVLYSFAIYRLCLFF